MWITFYALIILTLIAVIPNIPFPWEMPKVALFWVLGFIFIASTWWSDKIKTLTFKNKWVSGILIYTCLLFAWHFWRSLIFNNPEGNIEWHYWTIVPTLNLILGILIIQALVEWTDSLNRWVKLSRFLCWVGFAFGIYAIMQFCGIDQIFHKNFYWVDSPVTNQYKGEIFKSYRMITFMGNSMHTANLLAILSPLCLIFKGLRYKLVYIVLGIAVILTKSAISYIALITGLLVYLLLTKRYLYSGILMAMCLVLGIWVGKVSPNLWALGDRFWVWKKVLTNWINRPFTGWGLGNLPAQGYILPVKESYINTPLCEFIEILHDGGLILFILVIGYLVTLARRIIFVSLTKLPMLLIGFISGFCSYLIIALGSNPLHIVPLALVGIVYISGLEAQLEGRIYD